MAALPAFERFRGDARALIAIPEIRTISELDEQILGRESAEALLLKALQQVVEGHGQTEDDPLTGLGVEGFYVLARSCGHEVFGQSANVLSGGRVLDCMRLRGEDLAGTYEVKIYNLVEEQGE